MYLTKSVNFSQSGLSTVGYTLYDNNGAEYQARTTANVIELGTSGVYQVQVPIPDDFNGTLLWDDGQTEALYAGEDLSQILAVNIGTIKDHVDYVLEAFGQHRKAVEPVIGELKNYDDKAINKKIDDQLKHLQEVIKEAKQAQKEVKSVKDDIKAIHIPVTDLSGIEEYLKRIETFKNDYSALMGNMKKLEKNLESKIQEFSVSSRVDEMAEAIESELDNLKTNVENKSQQIADNFDTAVSKINEQVQGDLRAVFQKLEQEGGMAMLNVLNKIVGLINSGTLKQPEQSAPIAQPKPQIDRRFLFLQGAKK